MTDKDDDKRNARVISFPTNAIVRNRSHVSPKVSAQQTERIREAQTRAWVEDVTEDIMLYVIQNLSNQSVNTQTETFTTDLAFMIESLKALLLRDTGLDHPMLKVIDKLARVKIANNNRKYAYIDYTQILSKDELDKKSTQTLKMPKEVLEKLKDLQNGVQEYELNELFKSEDGDDDGKPDDSPSKD